MNVDNMLKDIINELGFDLYAQGSFTSSSDYPSSFFTYTQIDSEVDRHYDNQDNRTVWSFWLNFYTTEWSTVQTVLDRVRNLLKENNWLVPNRGRTVESDSEDHVGKELTIYFIEYN